MSKIKNLIGIPFRDGGRDFSGMDCWGLAKEASKIFGREIPDFQVSCFDSMAVNRIFEDQSQVWEKLDLPELGCVVAMRMDMNHPETVQHMGVYIGEGRMIHTLRKRASHIVRIDDPYWSNHIEGFYRWKG